MRRVTGFFIYKKMEKTIWIKEQQPNVARTYTAQDGSTQVFNSRTFVLSDGVDEFAAEMVGDAAVNCREMDKSVPHRVQCQLRCRSYKDRNGDLRYSNEIIISKLV